MARNFRAAAATGPDWTDVQVYVRDLQNSSGGVVEFVLSCPADRYSGTVVVLAKHGYPVVVTGARPALDQVQGEWPNRENATLEGLAFALLGRLDNMYSPTGEQLPLIME